MVTTTDLPSAAPDPLRRGGDAPPERTLVDILLRSAETCPDEPAVDNGQVVLTYAEFVEAGEAVAERLSAAGVARGDRVGVRIPSGTVDLYVAIIGVLLAGAAYVPVDADDPEERATLVFGEAGVRGVLTSLDAFDVPAGLDPDAVRDVEAEHPDLDDDAWIIFTSGSTGKPKGVAVRHRSAAAFVDAEARMFLVDRPIAPGDRVMAGLSVAFDASCEEMWLAWRYGACLVPAPRSLVRSGMDLGPWLVANGITVVSTVPTLAAMWPTEALADIRLLIFGGEACPPELAERLVVDGREVWNTYGPTEATVVACGARMTAEGPVRIGLPLDGWDLVVVDKEGHPLPHGETGELIIGGVGLARYLDPAKDAEKFAPMPTLGWDRAYRSGDLVRFDGEGLLFNGRADDQVKLGGRRIELGEVDSALNQLPGVSGAAAAVRSTGAGTQLLVGYVLEENGVQLDTVAALERLRTELPAALVPRLVVVDSLPTRTSGKIDRDALPWPVGGVDDSAPSSLEGTAGWVAEQWRDLLGTMPDDLDDDFFDLGGGSLTAAQMVSRVRERYPTVTVADIYDYPTPGSLAGLLDAMKAEGDREIRRVRPTPLKSQVAQLVAVLVFRTVAAARWLTWAGIATSLITAVSDVTWLPTAPWWLLLIGWVALISPLGRLGLGAFGARLLAGTTEPGTYGRGSKVHLRLWAAERWVDTMGVGNLSCAPYLPLYARALGAKVADGVDLHALPPVTGMLRLGSGCAVEPEVDLSGHWLDGDRLHVGRVTVKPHARVGTRSLLGPGAKVGKRSELGAGSALHTSIPSGERWSGSPAAKVGSAEHPWPDENARRARRWVVGYALTSVVMGLLPTIALLAGAALLWPAVSGADSLGDAVRRGWWVVPFSALTMFVVLAALIWVAVRLLQRGLQPGYHRVHSGQGWRAWATVRLMDDARDLLFPLYSSQLTPTWLRSLGASIGHEVEASTVVMIPSLTSVGDGAFLADDTMVGGYELGGGYLHVEQTRVGKRAFLGNSGMTAPGRKVPKRGLVAVLSEAPERAKKGSSWLGSPPVQLRRATDQVDTTRTYDPPTSLKVRRALVELARWVPITLSLALAVLTAALLIHLWSTFGGWVALLLGGVVLQGVGALAGVLSALAKWVLVGRYRTVDHPLWSSFVWRTELADTFVELIGAPWIAAPAPGTPVINLWLRLMGARIGRGVWCETYWLPESDLIELKDASTVNQGCVVQTHLFHDRVMSMDRVTLGYGATLGPNSVMLPAAALGNDATVGPSSLVMRGESVPAGTRWVGNPIGPWDDDDPGAPTADVEETDDAD